jgi:hypothetical protein
MQRDVVVRFYAGIGSRSTPPEVQGYMTALAAWLGSVGYTLRSGGAQGADTAFELGAATKEIYKGFDSTLESESVAAGIHPAWHAVGSYARRLHGRSVNIILGKNLDSPVDFVVCYTPNAQKVGGTRTGIVCAEQAGIPVFNLADPSQAAALSDALNKLAQRLRR